MSIRCRAVVFVKGTATSGIWSRARSEALPGAAAVRWEGAVGREGGRELLGGREGAGVREGHGWGSGMTG